MYIVKKISQKMCESGKIIPEEMELFSYGLECLFLKLVHIISYLVIAIVMNRVKEVLIILAVAIPLRENAGGYHAKTVWGCYVLSCTTICCSLYCYEFVSNKNIYFVMMGLSLFIFLLLSPIDNTNKKLNLCEKAYFRKRTFIIMGIVTVITIVMLAFNHDAVFELCIISVSVVAISLVFGKIIQVEKRPNKF